jgi:hypothetical protein
MYITFLFGAAEHTWSEVHASVARSCSSAVLIMAAAATRRGGAVERSRALLQCARPPPI